MRFLARIETQALQSGRPNLNFEQNWDGAHQEAEQKDKQEKGFRLSSFPTNRWLRSNDLSLKMLFPHPKPLQIC